MLKIEELYHSVDRAININLNIFRIIHKKRLTLKKYFVIITSLLSKKIHRTLLAMTSINENIIRIKGINTVDVPLLLVLRVVKGRSPGLIMG